jgi:hypothetical protein
MENVIGKIESCSDRFQESHFWIHSMEQFYHYADPFRWHLNAFLRSLKEVPQLLQMELQNEAGFSKWFRNHRAKLASDPLISFLSKQRDYVVHRGMLIPGSKGAIGLTEGRGIKFGLSFPIHPLEDSDHAMHRYLSVSKEHGDILELLRPDEESLPCVKREWRIPSFDEEVLDLAAVAWLRVGETIASVLHWLGVEPPQLSLDCRHSSQQVQYKLYERNELRQELKKIKGKTRRKRPVGQTSNKRIQRRPRSEF